jgi:hypothetical protein
MTLINFVHQNTDLPVSRVEVTRNRRWETGVVRIATRHWLNSQGIESRWGRDIPHPTGPALGTTQLPVLWVPGHYRT